MTSYPNQGASAPPTPSQAIGIAATEAAAHAMFGNLGVSVTASYQDALDGKAEFYLVHSGHPADKKGGRYWSLALLKSADIPALIDEAHAEAVKKARAEGRIIPTRDAAVDAFKRFHTGVKKHWLAGTVGAVVEIDHLPRAEQERLYDELEQATGLKWTLKVFSGGKSVHAYLAFDRLLSASDPIRLEIQQLLIAILEGDPAIVDPGRLTRLPGWCDPQGRREQPVLRLDDAARVAPEAIRDRLLAHATSIGMVQLDAAVSALQLAKRLDDAARAPRDAVQAHAVPTDAVALAATLRTTRFTPKESDLDLAQNGARVLRTAAQLHSRSEEAGGMAGRELRQHADLLRLTWQSPKPDDLDLADAMLGRASWSSGVAGIGARGIGGPSSSGVYYISASEMEPFRDLAFGTRVVAPCCGTGGSGRTDGSGVVMHQPGESSRLYCHRCQHMILVDPGPITPGFQKFGFDGRRSTTSPKKKIEASSGSPVRLNVNGKRLSDEVPDPMSQFGDTGGILVVRSPQETGKTYLAGLIAKKCNARWPDEAQVAPTHRVALVRNLAGRLGYVTYDVDPTGLKVATTLDSICRIPTYDIGDGKMLTDRRFSFVLLDEVSQLLRHAVGGTIGADAPRVLNHLRMILCNARYIVAMDADAADNEVEILQRLAPKRKVVIVDNDWRPSDRKARMYDDRKAHLADFIKDVEEGKKVAYLTGGGPKRAATVAKMAKDTGNNATVRVYSQDTSKLDEVQKELADIDAAMKKYGVVLATPTLGSGVDIQDRDFERVYLDVPAHDVGADEAVQLGFRIRNPRDRMWRVWVDGRKQSRETSASCIRAELLDVRRQTEGTIARRYRNSPLVKLVTPTEMSPQDDLHLDLYCRAWGHVHRQTNDLRRAMRVRLEEAGFTTEEAPKADLADLKKTAENFKEAKEKTTRERASRIAKAADITKEEADRIDRARTATQAELDAAEKANIEFFYGKTANDALVIEDDRGRLRAKVALLATHLLARDKRHREALVRDVQRVHQGLTARIRGQYVAALLPKKVLALYGVTAPVEKHMDAVEPVPDFDRKIRKFLPLIKRFLNVNHRPKTKTVNGQVVRIGDIDEVRLISRVLDKFGLKLVSRGRRPDGTRIYYLDTDLAAHRIELAQAARDRLVEALAKLEEDAHGAAPAVDDDEIDIDAILAGTPSGKTASVVELLSVETA